MFIRSSEKLRISGPTDTAAPADTDVCPITHLELHELESPYAASDGFIYEKEGLKKWLRVSPTSPMTTRPMPLDTRKLYSVLDYQYGVVPVWPVIATVKTTLEKIPLKQLAVFPYVMNLVVLQGLELGIRHTLALVTRDDALADRHVDDLRWALLPAQGASRTQRLALGGCLLFSSALAGAQLAAQTPRGVSASNMQNVVLAAILLLVQNRAAIEIVYGLYDLDE